jgi:multiple sugar transport system substrate-binding protein
MKKSLFFILLLFISAPAIFSLSRAEKPAEKAVLTVIGPWAGPEMDAFTPVLEAFEEKENVTAKYRIYRAEDLSSVLPVQADAQQAPGDVIAMWSWWVQENHDYAADLRDIWNAEKDAIIPSPGESGGKVVTVPYAMSVKPGFWYRKSFFERHGLEVPDTWDEFESLLRKIGGINGIKAPIVTGNGVGWPISDVTEHFIASIGGADLHRDLTSKKAKWTDFKTRDVFANYIVRLLEAGAFSDPIEWTQAVELWWSGDYALYFMGNWITGMVDDPNDLGVFALPGTKSIVAIADFFFVPAYSENVELAKKLLGFLISREGQELRAKQGGKLMVRNDVSSSVYPKADQDLAAVVSRMEETVDDMDDKIGGDWQRLFWDQLKLLWVEPDSLDDVLKKLQAGQ